MSRLKKKLNSRKGASITYALLIFLVCAVVGSAVLVAGTTAAGRMSKLAESDQRYYAVSSAARLIMDQLDDDLDNKKTVIIEKETGTDGVSKYLFKDKDGTLIFQIQDGSISGSFNSFSCEASYLVYRLVEDGSTVSITKQLTLSTDSEISALQVSISEKLDKVSPSVSNLDLEKYEYTLTMENANGDDKYILKLVFNSDDVEPLKIEKEDGSGSTVRKLSWHLKDIQVVGAQRWNLG